MKTISTYTFLVAMLFCSLLAEAQLVVAVSRPKTTGQKAVIVLKIKNGLAGKVESARALCFLLDGQGQMLGESSKWVIGGTKNRPALDPQKETSFNFVITSSQPFATTNLTAKVSFSRVALEGEKLANPKTDVQIQNIQ